MDERDILEFMLASLHCPAPHLYNVPSGSRPKHLKPRPKAELTDRWDGMGYQKCYIIYGCEALKQIKSEFLKI